jgi:hypothetical protein
MINPSFTYITCHGSMSGKYDPPCQLLQFETCTLKLIVKTSINQEGTFELIPRTFVGHVNLSLANSQATIFRICVSDFIQNLLIE